MKAKSVLVIGNFLSRYGMNPTTCEELSAHLVASGWDVITCSNKHSKSMRLLDMLLTAWRQHRRYSVAHIDVYSGTAFLWAEAVSYVLRKVRKPYILTLHGGNLPHFARRWPTRVQRLLGSATAVTVPSHYLQHQMAAYHEDLILLPNPIDLPIYRFIHRQTPNPTIVWLRAFNIQYNPELAAEVIAALRYGFPNVKLIMVGPDKHDGSFEQFEAAVRRLGINKQVHCVGGIAKCDVPIWLNRADIFLNTTNVDNTPVSVIEAMACGLCIISTNVGGIPYLLENERDALLVPPNDPQAMANGVRRVITEPGLAEHLSHNARTKAEKLDWSVVLPKWEYLLTEVMHR